MPGTKKKGKGKRKRDEDRRLESLVFGDESVVDNFGKEASTEAAAPKRKRRRASKTVEGEMEEEAEGLGDKKPVWHDEDDEDNHVNISASNRLRKLRTNTAEEVVDGSEYVGRLRTQFNKMASATKWADLGRKVESDASLRTSGALLAAGQEMPAGAINVTRMKDANKEEPNQSVVQSVQFHSNGQMLLTAGFDKRLRFFQVDGERNPKLQSVYLDMPIHTAQFTRDGMEVIATGRRKFFYVYDLGKSKVEKIHRLQGREEKSLESFVLSPPSSTHNENLMAIYGHSGNVLLVSLKSKQLVGTMKMNGTLRAASFSPDGRELVTTGGDGEVYIWDVASRRCVHKYVDDGCLNGTAVHVSPDGRYHGVGSDSGIVNVYDAEAVRQGAKPKPLRVVDNLTTTAHVVKFNHDSQVLAVASRLKKDSMRLLHLPSMTVFSNWPTAKTPLHYVSAVDFSPTGGFMAVGNDRGKVLLYRLNHYLT